MVFMCKVASQARNESQRTTALEAMCKEKVPRKVRNNPLQQKNSMSFFGAMKLAHECSYPRIMNNI